MTENREFWKKRNLCADICEIQKTYGTERFFRKFKWFIELEDDEVSKKNLIQTELMR